VIRAAGWDDAAALAQLAAETFPLACPPATTPDQIAAFIADNLTEQHFAGYLADKERIILVIDVRDRLLGYTMTIFGEPTDPDVLSVISRRPTAELSKVYLRKSEHGSGQARDLVAATLEEAQIRRLASIWLGVNQFNERANRFYEKHGFAQVGTKHFSVGGSVEDDFVREYRFF